MGGTGGGLGLSSEDLARLQETARAKIRSEEPERRNVFISFASEDLAQVNLLRGQSKNKQIELDFIDKSLKVPFNSDRAEYIRRGLRERIRQASVTVVLVTEKTASSKWVDWEIRESKRLGKGVVAMHPGEGPPSRLPSALKEFGIKTIRWSHQGLTDAIKDAAKQR